MHAITRLMKFIVFGLIAATAVYQLLSIGTQAALGQVDHLQQQYQAAADFADKTSIATHQ